MSRRDIHYWKCDRPAAFYGTRTRISPTAEIEQQLRFTLLQHFRPRSLQLSLGCGQGNHLTWNAELDGKPLFIRVENGPEKDDYLEMESAVLKAVGDIGVPVPEVHGCDVSRTHVPFAWQALERLNHQDLNHWYKQGALDSHQVFFEIGGNIARWQSIRKTTRSGSCCRAQAPTAPWESRRSRANRAWSWRRTPRPRNMMACHSAP